MFSLDELRRAEAVVRAALPPTPAIAWPLIARRLGAEAVVKHENHNPTGAFKVRGGLTFVDALKRRDAERQGHRLGDARQPRPEPRLRRRARRPGGAHLCAARQFDREERGDARARRRAGRARRRLPGGARGSDAGRRRKRPRRRARLSSRPRARRFDLRARAARRRIPTSTSSTRRSARARGGSTRDRQGRASAAASRRATRWG